MTVGSYPLSRHLRSIWLRMVALARWVKFQVRRYSTPPVTATAMWTASHLPWMAEDLRLPAVRKRFSRLTYLDFSDTGQSIKTLGRHRSISCGRFRNNESRYVQLVLESSFRPPRSSHRLARRDDDVPARLGSQVADDGVLNVDRRFHSVRHLPQTMLQQYVHQHPLRAWSTNVVPLISIAPVRSGSTARPPADSPHYSPHAAAATWCRAP